MQLSPVMPKSLAFCVFYSFFNPPKKRHFFEEEECFYVVGTLCAAFEDKHCFFNVVEKFSGYFEEIFFNGVGTFCAVFKLMWAAQSELLVVGTMMLLVVGSG